MVALVFMLASCGWWEARQACDAARDGEAAAWQDLDTVLDSAQSASATLAEAKADAAEGIDAALGASRDGAGALDEAARGSMAQDAYSRASRLGADAGLAAEAARWADYTLQTQGAMQEADRLAERAARESERLAAWGDSYAESALALALAAARYESRVRDAQGRRDLQISLALASALSPAPAEDVDAAALRQTVDSRREGFDARKEDFGTVIANAEKLAYMTDRAGTVAITKARDLDFLDFPASAQVARAAAAGAAAAGGRAVDAAKLLSDSLATWKARQESATVTAPEAVGTAFAAAQQSSAKVAGLCTE